MAIRNRGGRLYIDFYFFLPNGSRTRAFEPIGKKSKKTLALAKSKEKGIQYHLSNNSFYYPDFFPHGSKNKYFEHTSEILFSDWWHQFMSESSTRPSTAAPRKSYYRQYLSVYFEGKLLSEIQESDLLMFRNWLKEQKISDVYINNITFHLCALLTRAHERKIIQSNPCLKFKPIRVPKPNIRPLNFLESDLLLETVLPVDPEFHDLLSFWGDVGLRPGELISLKWKDYDVENSILMIRRTKSDVVKSFDGPPKTPHSQRDLPLRPGAVEVLAQQRERSDPIAEYIWPVDGKQYRHARLVAKFKRFLRLAGLDERPPVHMRHTFATLHIAAGESISWVSHMMGHSSVTITIEKYNRFIPNLTHKDGSAIEKLREEIRKGNIEVTD